MKNIILAFIMLFGFSFITYTAGAQGTGQLNITFSPERASAAAGFNEFDIVVSAGKGYITDNAIYVPNKTNLNGSWTSINLRFTQGGTGAPFTNTELAVTYPVSGISGSTTAQNLAQGGCYSGKPAFSINILRSSPAADASATPLVIATVRYPNTSGQKTLTIRSTTTQACAIRESFWSNTHSRNSSTRLPIVGNSVSFYNQSAAFMTRNTVTFDKQYDMKLYPNPTSGDQVTVEMTSDTNREEAQIIIQDAVGRIINRQAAALSKGMNQVALSTADLSPGVYFVRLENVNQASAPIKLIKE